MRMLTIVAIGLASVSLAACGEKENPVKASGSDPYEITRSAPAAPADRGTSPDPTPATHAIAPAPADTPAAYAATPTARDTPAQQPLKEMTAAEESKSMPKSGQANNYSSTAIEASQGKPSNDSSAPAK